MCNNYYGLCLYNYFDTFKVIRLLVYLAILFMNTGIFYPLVDLISYISVVEKDWNRINELLSGTSAIAYPWFCCA